MSESRQAFNRRLGVERGPPIDRDFPKPARIALLHVLLELIEDEVLLTSDLERELLRLRRIRAVEGATDDFGRKVLTLLEPLPWERVFVLCERVHEHLLRALFHYDADGEPYEVTSLAEAREKFEREVDAIMQEEHMAYAFHDGQFTRPGHKVMEKNVAAARAALARTELAEARQHFAKALRFLEAGVAADYPNAIKEAVSAIEAALVALFPTEADGAEMPLILTRLQGVGEGEIPPAIAQGMTKLYGFRGAGEGVSHGGAAGGTVTPELAELCLSQAAAYIEYAVLHRARLEQGVPF